MYLFPLCRITTPKDKKKHKHSHIKYIHQSHLLSYIIYMGSFYNNNPLDFWAF